MISVSLALGDRGEFRSVSASGHAGVGLRGADIVCSAVSALLRTTMTALSGAIPDLVAESSGRGSLSFRVPEGKDPNGDLLVYAGMFLRTGLESIAEEYPDAVSLTLTGPALPAT